MTRVQKIRWYAEQLIKDGTEAERKGEKEAAISRFLQAADLLLLLSKGEENYTIWRNYTDNASMCQRKARLLIAAAPRSRP